MLQLSAERSIMSTAKELFIECFNKINNVVEYKDSWANGTGYLDNAVKDKSFSFNEFGYAKAESPAGRKIIIIRTVKGNVVLFERYTGPESSVIVGNMPRSIKQLFQLSGSIPYEKVYQVLGDPDSPTVVPNIGLAIDEFMFG